MCGRYRLAADAELIAQIFGLIPEFIEIRIEPSFNVAPTERGLVVLVADVAGQPTRRLVYKRWGLLPPWSHTLRDGAKMINARAEAVTTTPAFREAFRKRRCVVPADGWYEWQAPPPSPGALFGGAPPEAPRPHVIRRPDRGLLALAGLFEAWQGPDGVVETYTILTRSSRPPITGLHARMPVLLDETGVNTWLDPKATPELLARCLEGADLPLEFRPVHPSIGQVRTKAEPIELSDVSPGIGSPRTETG